MTGLWWLLAFAAPVAAALVLLVRRAPAQVSSRPQRALAIAGKLLALVPAMLLTLLPGVTSGEVTRVAWLLTGASFSMDYVGRALTFVTVLLYGAALTAVARRRVPRAAELSAFLLLCFTGNVGVFTAADAVTFYLCFAVMSYSAVGLVISTRTGEARRAARIYLVLAVISETFTLAALILVAGAGGLELAATREAVAGSPHATLISVLLVLGFGIKAGLVPLHVWLPLAHPAAPPAASAVLSGAMVKAGIVGWIRFLPLGELAIGWLGTVLVVLGVIGAFGSVVVGVQQSNPKTVLAYSTVSQLGFLTIVVGVALAVPVLAPACITAALIYAVHHGLAKGAAFLGVSVWRHHGRGWHRWIVVTGMTLAGLAIVGAPLSSGSIGKYAAKNAVEGIVVAGVDLVHVLPWVATGSTLLLLRVAVLMSRAEREPAGDLADPELVSWLGLVALSIPVPWLVAWRWLPLADVPDLEPVTVWDATWPALVGVAVFVIAWWGLRSWVVRLPQLPAGDLVVPVERAVGAVRRRGLGWLEGLSRPPLTLAPLRRAGTHALARGEAGLQTWALAVGVVIALTTLIIVGGS